jgi:hypothetical protein
MSLAARITLHDHCAHCACRVHASIPANAKRSESISSKCGEQDERKPSNICSARSRHVSQAPIAQISITNASSKTEQGSRHHACPYIKAEVLIVEDSGDQFLVRGRRSLLG